MANLKQPKSQLIIIGGFAGSGKSTISKKLAEKLGWPRLEIDFFLNIMFNMRELNGLAREEKATVAYDTAYALVRDHIRSGRDLIFDINMCNSLAWKEIAKIKKCRKKIIILKCPFEICRKRAGKRFRENPGTTLVSDRTLDGVRYKWEFIEKLDDKAAIFVDASRGTRQVFEEVLKKINKG